MENLEAQIRIFNLETQTKESAPFDETQEKALIKKSNFHEVRKLLFIKNKLIDT